MSNNELVEFVTGRFDKLDEKMTDGFQTMNGRVRKLERYRDMGIGAFALLSFIVTLLGVYVKFVK